MKRSHSAASHGWDDRLILLTGHLPWWGQKQTPHYIAERLARSSRVMYIEPPVAWNRQTASFQWRRCGAVLRRPVRQINERLWIYTPSSLPLGRFPPVARVNHNHFSTGLQKAVRQLSKTEPLLWLADTVNSPQVRDLYPGAPGLFHAIDYFSGANRTTAVTLGRHVDMVLAATPLIAETFTQ